MDINIKIYNFYNGDVPINLEKMIMKLLKKVSKKYMIGLNNITTINKFYTRNLKNVGGVYFPRTKKELAHIEIAIDTIYKGMPRFLFYFPFISKFLLANVLYHEIGHHYQTEYVSRVKKNNTENFAEKFCNKQLKKTFLLWLIIFIPLWPLIKLLMSKDKK